MKSIPTISIVLGILLLVGTVGAATWTDAGGCWTATDGIYNIVMWNATGNTTWTVPPDGVALEYLVIAGGASGGAAYGAGGGAGGFRNGTGLLTTPGTVLNVSVGPGGANVTPAHVGNPGNDSFFGIVGGIEGTNLISATGGGFGGYAANSGGVGGSGGGGASNTAGGTGNIPNRTPAQGTNGGAGVTNSEHAYGGGGGAYKNGTPGAASVALAYGGKGGLGAQSDIVTRNTWTNFSCGGGGGISAAASAFPGLGGCAEAGNGGVYGSYNGTMGANNSGSGGGGGGFMGLSGGSGIVIIRYTSYGNIVANFTANTTTPAAPLGAVNFTDLSTNYPNAWLWNFGDGSTSTDQNPIHVYSVGGLKTVSLTAYQSFNGTNTNTLTKTNYINVTYDPTYVGADFTCSPTSGLPGLYVTCVDTSIYGNTTTTGRIYNWSFGDGGFASNGSVATHVYPYLGEFTVTMQVNNTLNATLGGGRATKQNYILISSNQNTQNTWWTPHTVQLTVMDVYGARLYDVTCNASFNQSAMPTEWINDLYGIQSGPQGDMINKTLYMVGTTGGDGTLTFTMLGSLKYDIYLTSMTYGLNNYYVSAFPSDSMLNVYVIANGIQPPTQENSTYQQIGNNTRVYFVEPNISYGSMCIDYQDTAGLTTSVTETWKFAYPNQTTIQTLTYAPGTVLTTNCYTLANVRGIQTWWGYNATRTV